MSVKGAEVDHRPPVTCLLGHKEDPAVETWSRIGHLPNSILVQEGVYLSFHLLEQGM